MSKTVELHRQTLISFSLLEPARHFYGCYMQLAPSNLEYARYYDFLIGTSILFYWKTKETKESIQSIKSVQGRVVQQKAKKAE